MWMKEYGYCKFLEIYFVYLGNKDIYRIFKMYSEMPILFPQTASYFTNLSLYTQKYINLFHETCAKNLHPSTIWLRIGHLL